MDNVYRPRKYPSMPRSYRRPKRIRGYPDAEMAVRHYSIEKERFKKELEKLLGN